MKNDGSKIKKALSALTGNRNMSLLMSGQLISQMGDSIFLIGLMWLVLDLTGSKAAMGTVAMVTHLPIFILGLFGGVLVDTFDRRKLMLVADIARAFIILIIPVTFFAGVISLPIILIVSVLLASFSTLFNPARDSLIPDLAGRENLVKANSLIQASNYLAILLGPAAGAVLLELFGVIHLFTADSISFFISFACVLAIRSRIKQEESKVSFSGITRKLWEVAGYIKTEKRLKFLIILTAINNFFIMGLAVVGIPIFVKEILHEGAASYAIVESALGLGMIIGAFIINPLNKKINKGTILLMGMIFDGITYAALYFIGSLELLILSIVIHAIGIPMIVVSRTSLVQEWTDSARMGRVFSIINISVIGLTALSTGFAGWLAEIVSVEIIFAVFGVGGMLCGIVGFMNKDLRNS